MKDDLVEPPEPTVEEEIKYLREQLSDSQKQVATAKQILGYDDGDLIDNVTRFKAYTESEIALREQKNRDGMKYCEDLQKQVAILRDALSEISTHLDPILAALIVSKRQECKPDDMAYWTHEINAHNKNSALIRNTLSSTTPPPYVHEDQIKEVEKAYWKGIAIVFGVPVNQFKTFEDVAQFYEDKLKQSRIKAMEECFEIMNNHPLVFPTSTTAIRNIFTDAIRSLITAEQEKK